MRRKFILTFASCILTLAVLAEWPLTENQKRAIEMLTNQPNAELKEQLTMVVYVNRPTLAWHAAVTQKMLEEANYFADKLQLPAKRPIQITDIQYQGFAPPWFGIIRKPSNRDFLPETIFSNRIYDAGIPREARLRALNFGTDGVIETTNFEFSFRQGKLLEVMRLSEHEVEYHANDLDKLTGMPSLIDTNGAYQLATQWLAAVDVDVPALEKLSGPLIKGGHSIHQLQVLPAGATNAAFVPIYYVDFGSRHFRAAGPNLKDYDKPLASVEVLGTTKELQDLEIAVDSDDAPYDHRPLLLITNALDLLCMPNPPTLQLQHPSQTNSASP